MGTWDTGPFDRKESEGDMPHGWKAEVTVTGVSTVTDEEHESVLASLPGGGLLVKTEGADEIQLDWLFETRSLDMWEAIERASAAWRGAVAHIESATDPECTDFRVYWMKET
jgi:hypothetical protein